MLKYKQLLLVVLSFLSILTAYTPPPTRNPNNMNVLISNIACVCEHDNTPITTTPQPIEGLNLVSIVLDPKTQSYSYKTTIVNGWDDRVYAEGYQIDMANSKLHTAWEPLPSTTNSLLFPPSIIKAEYYSYCIKSVDADTSDSKKPDIKKCKDVIMYKTNQGHTKLNLNLTSTMSYSLSVLPTKDHDTILQGSTFDSPSAIDIWALGIPYSGPQLSLKDLSINGTIMKCTQPSTACSLTISNVKQYSPKSPYIYMTIGVAESSELIGVGSSCFVDALTYNDTLPSAITNKASIRKCIGVGQSYPSNVGYAFLGTSYSPSQSRKTLIINPDSYSDKKNIFGFISNINQGTAIIVCIVIGALLILLVFQSNKISNLNIPMK